MIKTRIDARRIRQQRGRNKISGTATTPRLSVYTSNAHIHVQIIDDMAQKTLCAVSTTNLKLKSANVANAKIVGKEIAKLALAAGITKIVFDRGGNLYHGKIKALADAAREAGLKF